MGADKSCVGAHLEAEVFSEGKLESLGKEFYGKSEFLTVLLFTSNSLRDIVDGYWFIYG